MSRSDGHASGSGAAIDGFASGDVGTGSRTASDASGISGGIALPFQWVDLAALAFVPACLVAAFALPEPTRRSLALSYVDPSALTAFTAHFVHLEATHLAANVTAYAMVVPVAYLLCVRSGRRLEFFVAFATFLLAFPLALSALNVALVRPRIGYGFSGVNTAFLGFLPVALFGYLSVRLDVDVRRVAPAVFFGTLALMAGVSVPSSAVGRSVSVVAVVVALAYVRGSYPAVETALARLRARWRTQPAAVEVAVAGAVVLVVFPLAAFPTDPAAAGRVVNVYVHLLGYALGFITSYVTFALVGIDGQGSQGA